MVSRWNYIEFLSWCLAIEFLSEEKVSFGHTYSSLNSYHTNDDDRLHSYSEAGNV